MANLGMNHIPPGTPIYHLLSPCYLEDDTLHGEGEEIAYLGTPNEFMAPMNEPARERMQKFLQHLDNCAREKAAAMGRPFTGRVTELGDQIAEAMGDAKRAIPEVQIVTPVRAAEVPLRPDLVPLAQRQNRTTNVVASKAPAPPGKPQPKPISTLGRNYDRDAASNGS